MRRSRIRALFVSVVIASVATLATFAATRGQPQFGVIRGEVKDAAGAARPGAAVSITRPGAAERRTVTNAQGGFEFLSVEPGHYTIVATLGGIASRSIAVQVDDGKTATVALVLSISNEIATTIPPPPLAAPQPPPEPAKQRLMVGGGAGGVIGGVSGGMVGGLAGSYQQFVGAQFNTEAYERVNDNQWFDVAHKPLSTFSADVDTASYSNVRRFLNQGQAPPPDAVRIEELINYFQYDYAEPRDGKPIAVSASIGECPWNPAHRLALIGLQAKKIDASGIPPRNLVFLIDVSGSMMPANKLPLVKASLAMLAPNLTDKDRVAIVVYAGSTGLVLPSTPGSDTSTILDALKRLEAGGSTNGGAGLALAYKVAQEHFITGGVNRVILATDGDFNVGVTDQGSLLRMIEDKRQSGIALSVLGYGMGNVKDSTMVKLADTGNGNYAYIDTLAEANKVLVEQAGGTLVTAAKDVKLQVEFNPRAVAAYRLIGYEKRLLQDRDFNDDKKDAGEIGAGHSVTVLYELIPAGQKSDVPAIDPMKYQEAPLPSAAARSDEALNVRIRYKAADSETSSLIEVPLPNRMAASEALGFAAAVAEFGMLLRDSEHKGTASFSQATALARQFRGADPHGHRAEFIRLIGAAEGVTRIRTTAQQ